MSLLGGRHGQEKSSAVNGGSTKHELAGRSVSRKSHALKAEALRSGLEDQTQQKEKRPKNRGQKKGRPIRGHIEKLRFKVEFYIGAAGIKRSFSRGGELEKRWKSSANIRTKLEVYSGCSKIRRKEHHHSTS